MSDDNNNKKPIKENIIGQLDAIANELIFIKFTDQDRLEFKDVPVLYYLLNRNFKDVKTLDMVKKRALDWREYRLANNFQPVPFPSRSPAVLKNFVNGLDDIYNFKFDTNEGELELESIAFLALFTNPDFAFYNIPSSLLNDVLQNFNFEEYTGVVSVSDFLKLCVLHYFMPYNNFINSKLKVKYVTEDDFTFLKNNPEIFFTKFEDLKISNKPFIYSFPSLKSIKVLFDHYYFFGDENQIVLNYENKNVLNLQLDPATTLYNNQMIFSPNIFLKFYLSENLMGITIVFRNSIDVTVNNAPKTNFHIKTKNCRKQDNTIDNEANNYITFNLIDATENGQIQISTGELPDSEYLLDRVNFKDNNSVEITDSFITKTITLSSKKISVR